MRPITRQPSHQIPADGFVNQLINRRIQQVNKNSHPLSNRYRLWRNANRWKSSQTHGQINNKVTFRWSSRPRSIRRLMLNTQYVEPSQVIQSSNIKRASRTFSARTLATDYGTDSADEPARTVAGAFASARYSSAGRVNLPSILSGPSGVTLRLSKAFSTHVSGTWLVA